MKKTLLSSVAVALLLFSGCSSKEPTVAEDQQVLSDTGAGVNGGSSGANGGVEVIDGEGIDGNGIHGSGADSDESKMMSVQSKMESIYFDFDKFEVKSSMEANLRQDAELAKQNSDSFKFKLEGNCDEWGSDEYNFALGLKRAKAVKEALIAQGVNANSITMVSYGESNPSCKEHTQACWAKNRRVDVKVMP